MEKNRPNVDVNASNPALGSKVLPRLSMLMQDLSKDAKILEKTVVGIKAVFEEMNAYSERERKFQALAFAKLQDKFFLQIGCATYLVNIIHAQIASTLKEMAILSLDLGVSKNYGNFLRQGDVWSQSWQDVAMESKLINSSMRERLSSIQNERGTGICAYSSVRRADISILEGAKRCAPAVSELEVLVRDFKRNYNVRATLNTRVEAEQELLAQLADANSDLEFVANMR